MRTGIPLLLQRWRVQFSEPLLGRLLAFALTVTSIRVIASVFRPKSCLPHWIRLGCCRESVSRFDFEDESQGRTGFPSDGFFGFFRAPPERVLGPTLIHRFDRVLFLQL